jgi:GNAT superfamily N-acetyltransferase
MPPQQLSKDDIELRPTDANCKTRHFTSGVKEIDRWFCDKALKKHLNFVCRVTVAYLPNNATPVGFYSLVLNAEPASQLRNGGKGLGLLTSSFPCINLWYLATRHTLQRNGIGRLLLGDAIEKVYIIAQHAGLIGMTLVAIDAEVATFYASMGFGRYAGNTDRPKMLLPIQSIIELVEQNA